MTTAYADTIATAEHPYDTHEFTSLPQTPDSATGQSIWTGLRKDLQRLSKAPCALDEYRQWQQLHGWSAHTPVELAADLRDDPAALGAVVGFYQAGSRLAAAILVEAFRPALITFTRYARIDECEQIGRSEVRAQVVLAVFYEVASTTDSRSSSIAGRLYGETLKRVTRQRQHVTEYPSDACRFAKKACAPNHRMHTSRPESVAMRWAHNGGLRDDDSALRRTTDYYEPTDIDVAPIATRPGLDWDSVERKGLARDVIVSARDNGIISSAEHDLLHARFLGDTLVPVPTLARQIGQSKSYCETKIRRALLKLSTHYATNGRAAASTVA